ncbi:MAG TPA: SAM-dependent methyltransferase, partial [Dermatophilaceae bacterium]
MSAATELLSILQAAIGGPLPIRIKCWDGSQAGDTDAAATVVFVRRRAMRRLLWSPNELGLVRAYVSGDVDFEGDIFTVLD